MARAIGRSMKMLNGLANSKMVERFGLSEALERLLTGLLGHRQIEDDEIGRLALDQLERRHAVICAANVVTLVLKKILQQVDDRSFVVYDQDDRVVCHSHLARVGLAVRIFTREVKH